MKIFSWCRLALVLGVAVAASVSPSAGPAVAEEPARKFLEALRQEGLFDLAREYLEQMEKSPLVSQEFRETILYEQGLTLMAVSRMKGSNFSERQQRLDEAQQKFSEFLTAHKNHDFAPKAKSELANVLVERARVKMSEADRAKSDADKAALLKQAREFYQQSHDQFKQSQEEIGKKLESIPKVLDPKRDAKRIAFRDELRTEYLKVQLVQATILHEMADTALDAKDRNELLKQAAEAYGTVHEKYRRRYAGLISLLKQGECYQEMGGKENITEAIGFYMELLEQPYNSPPMRVLRTKTLVQTLQAMLDDAIEEKKLDPAIITSTEWIQQMRPDEFRDDDWLKLHLEAARAYQLKIAEMEENDPKRALAMKSAIAIVDHGLKYGDSQMKEKFLELKTKLGAKVDKPKEERPDPKTFAEAYAAGRKAWDLIKQHSATKEILDATLKKTKDKAERAETEKKLAELQEEMVSARFDAVDFYRKALLFATRETDLDEVNNVRYYLCSLHFTEKNYYDTATYGEFLASSDPGHPAANYCAKLARASYLNLYNGAPEDDRDFEAGRVVDICELMLDEWGENDDADETLIILIKFMVIQQRLDEARKYLAQIKPDSSRRGEAEIATGQAMWSTYLKGLRQVREWETQVQTWQDELQAWNKGEAEPPAGVTADSRKSEIAELETKIDARKQELAPMKDEAQLTLKNGIERMRAKGIDSTLASAVIALCQIYVDAEQAPEAIALLEDKDIGPLTLVKNDHEAVKREGFAQETYKMALRAYIGSLPSAANKKELIDKAEGAMDGLKGTVSQDAQGQQKLIEIYLALAGEVKKQIDLASPANKKPLTQGFSTFLDKVAATSNDVPMLNSVAEQFYTLGVASDPGQGEPPAEAKQYYDKASDLYTKLIEKAKSDETIADRRKMLIHLRRRLASVLRRQGKFVLAMDQMEEVLKENQGMLDLQVEAAETYAEWAASDLGVDKLYVVAVSGGRQNKARKKNIWGWGRIGEVMSGQLLRNKGSLDDEQVEYYTELMHQAKLAKAECYYKYALSLDDEKDRKKWLDGAKAVIFQTSRSYPSLGGPVWQKKYDELTKEIQSNLKEEVVGLEAFAKADDEVASAEGAVAPGGGGQ